MRFHWRFIALLLVALLVSSPAAADAGDKQKKGKKAAGDKQKKGKKAATEVSMPETKVMWRDPGAVETLDFVGGPGGRDGAPMPPFTFVKELFAGTRPKVRVRDAKGVEWSVKWGSEVKPEVFATRLAWAAGYFVEPSYYMPQGKITGARGLKRAAKHVRSDGSFVEARFELRAADYEKLDGAKGWLWDSNPFVGTKELNGLRVMTMLVSNWDAKDASRKDGSNNAIFRYTTPNGIEAQYLVKDWGASMGKWGGVFSHGNWDCDDYASQSDDLVEGVEDGVVEWGYSAKLTDKIRDNVRASDVTWLMQYLGRVTDAQLRDGLRVSGATPSEVECFTRAVRTRIEALRRVR